MKRSKREAQEREEDARKISPARSPNPNSEIVGDLDLELTKLVLEDREEEKVEDLKPILAPARSVPGSDSTFPVLNPTRSPHPWRPSRMKKLRFILGGLTSLYSDFCNDEEDLPTIEEQRIYNLIAFQVNSCLLLYRHEINIGAAAAVAAATAAAAKSPSVARSGRRHKSILAIDNMKFPRGWNIATFVSERLWDTIVRFSGFSNFLRE